MDRAADDRLTFVCAVAVRAELEALLPRFGRAHGVEVEVTYDVNPAVAKRVMAGEPFDVGLTNPWYVEEMIAAGQASPDLHVPFGRVPLAIGAAGSAPPEIETSYEAVRALLAASRSIAYTEAGTSGKTFLRAIETMGLAPQIESRLHPMAAGEPPIAAAEGRVQHAVSPLSRIIATPGVVPVATFPGDLGLSIDLSMFVPIASRRRDRAEQLMRFLSEPAHDPYLQSHGIARYGSSTEGCGAAGARRFSAHGTYRNL